MAENERLIHASPSEVFSVLADPRGYAYWVLGSMEIREADPHWPEPGSRFDHTVGFGPIRIADHTKVEEVRPGRYLQLKAKTRPLGTARVKLELHEAGDGTRVTMVEDPADRMTAYLFSPLVHLLVWARNVRSLDRLAELAEGRVPIPGDESGAPSSSTDGPGAVENPLARERRNGHAAGVPSAIGRGLLAGLAGGLVMSVSTNVEMRLRGRSPSHAPAEALGRILGVKTRGRRRKQRLTLAGHLGTAVSLGAARGLMGAAGVGSGKAGSALFAMALTPEVVVVPALGAADPPWRWSATDAAVSLLHHGVYAGATNVAYGLLERRA